MGNKVILNSLRKKNSPLFPNKYKAKAKTILFENHVTTSDTEITKLLIT